MGSEQIFKKSMLGGFKKEGVLNYIEQLQTEIIDLKKEITNKPDLSDDVKALKSANEDASAEIIALKAKNDALNTENESLSEKNSVLIQELDNAKKVIAEYDVKQKLFEDKISAIESKFSQLTNGYIFNNTTETKIASKAKTAVENAKSEVSRSNEAIISASAALKDTLENLMGLLSDISDELDS